MTVPPPAAASAPSSSATTRRAYDAIRADIGSGVFAPGAWLREASVAASLGLSRTPVREALRMLAAEGAVELVHNRGARVVRWSAADIDEVFRLRALLEGHAASLAARHASKAQIAELHRLPERHEPSAAAGDADGATARCNNDFHAAILTASGSQRLETLLDVISSAHLVSLALRQYSAADRQRSVLHHRDIVMAIQKRDECLAEAAMRSHILAARYAALRLTETDG